MSTLKIEEPTVCDSSVDRYAKVLSVSQCTEWDCKLVLMISQKGYWADIWFTRVFNNQPLYNSIKAGDKIYTEGLQFTKNFYKLIKLQYANFESCSICGKYFEGECCSELSNNNITRKIEGIWVLKKISKSLQHQTLLFKKQGTGLADVIGVAQFKGYMKFLKEPEIGKDYILDGWQDIETRRNSVIIPSLFI